MLSKNHPAYNPEEAIKWVRAGVPFYLEHLDLEVIGSILHTVNAILGYYYMSPEHLKYEFAFACSSEA